MAKSFRAFSFDSQEHFPYLFVLVCCVAAAILIGIHQPELAYQKAAVKQIWQENGETHKAEMFGIATGPEIVVPMRRAEHSQAYAAFLGKGRVERVEIDLEFADQSSLERLEMNGKLVCSPCKDKERYLAEAEGNLFLFLQATNKTSKDDETEGGKRWLTLAYAKEDWIEAPADVNVRMSMKGGWAAEAYEKMPSSIYQIDAPFHIARIRMLQEYLPNMEIPWSRYSFISMIPAGIFSAITGSTAEYSFKIYSIIVFFAPIALFAAFSKSISKGRKSSFLFASLFYLFTPAASLLTGGAPDLFFYGVAPHTIATYLSLSFFAFAYWFLDKGKPQDLAFSALFFALAFACNQRIAMPMGIMALVLLAAFLFQKKFARAAALCAACGTASLFFAFPFFASIMTGEENVGAYSPLLGVNIHSYFQGMAGILQTGFAFLPALFALGAYFAFKERERFAAVLLAAAAAVFLFAASPEINRAFPFVDGLRLLPSFFLPFFFLAGMGASGIYRGIAGILEKKFPKGKKGAFDRETAGGAVVFALILPLASVFFVYMSTTISQIKGSMDSAMVALDYASMAEIYGLVGEERAVFEPLAFSSQYPTYWKDMGQVVAQGHSNNQERIETLAKARARYFILGPNEIGDNKSTNRLEDIRQMQQDARFEQVPIMGSARLFVLKAGENGRKAYVDGGEIRWQRIRFERASLSGECLADECNVTIFAEIPPYASCRLSGSACQFESDGKAAKAKVGRGSFALEIAPQPRIQEWALALASLFGLLGVPLLWRLFQGFLEN
ncbi:MAG: hypothetical protein N3F07_00710 [Candidatus Micrarchaeota archaeon]|nr:hypothetical protein [Candidatus Micrarchaeota archaeon]